MERYQEVLTSLRRLIRATDLHSRYLNKTSGLTSPQLLILQTLANNGAMISRNLAKQVNLSQATVISILERLESKGLVERKRSDDDRRKIFVKLTPLGTDKVKSAPLPLQDSFINQFKQLQDWEQSMILASLQRLAIMMDADKIDAAPLLDIGDLDRPAAEQGIVEI
jgi:DNA-binding MarR family transcriptional regulator